MKDALTYIVKSIVDNPDSVVIEEEEQDGFMQFSISVDPEDMGKVIGKEGKVIRAIRNVMKIPAVKNNKKIHIVLAEQEK